MENQKTKRIGNIGRLLLTLFSAALAVAGFYLIIYSWDELKLRNLEEATGKQLLIVGLLILEYFLIAFVFICFTAFIKKGFGNIGSIGDGGVLTGFFLGFVFWVSIGVVALLLGGVLAAFGTFGIIETLIFVLILSTLFGLVGFLKEIREKTGNH